MGLYRFVQQCDILGVEATLFTNKNYSLYKNFFGGFLSIMVFLLIFSGTIFFIKEFINREQTNLIAGFVDDFSLINERFNSHPLMFRVSGNRGTLFPYGYYFIKAEYNEYDVEISTTQNTTYLSIERCSFDKHLKEKEELFYQYKEIANEYYCINWGDIIFNLTGSYGVSSKYSYISIYFYDCYNEENPYQEQCMDKDLVDKGLMESYVDLVTITNKVDHQMTIPNEEVLYKARIPVSSSVFKRIWLYCQAVSYTTDFGFLFKELTEDFFYKISGYNVDVDIRVGFPFVYLTVVNNSEKLTYSRSHMKAPTFLANIGGIIKGLTLIGSVLNYAVSKNLNNLELMNTLYTNQSLLKIYKIDKMVSKTSLKNVRSVLAKMENNNNQYNNNECKNIKDIKNMNEDSLSHSNKESVKNSNRNTVEYKDNFLSNDKDNKINIKFDHINYGDDTTQKVLINDNNNNDNINSNLKELNNNNNTYNNSAIINQHIKIKYLSKQKYMTNNYIRNNKSIVNNNFSDISNESNVSSCKDNTINQNKNNYEYINSNTLRISNIPSKRVNNTLVRNPKLSKSKINNPISESTNNKKDNSVFNNQGDLNVSLAKPQKNSEISYINIVRKRFSLTTLQLLDPMLLCLKKTQKRKHISVLQQAHEYLNHKNLIKTIQEYCYLKKIILDDKQNNLLDDIFNYNLDTEDQKLNKSVNTLAQKKEKSFIDNKILNVFEILD